MKNKPKDLLLSTYEDYLNEKALSPLTTINYRRELVKYLDWLNLKGEEYYKTTYQTVLNYISHLESKGNGKGTINRKLKTIEYFYELLELKENPVIGLRVRGGIRLRIYELLEEKTLEDLYETYDQGGLAGVRDKCMLGMIIYQGLRRSELLRLKEEDVDLEKGEIYIKETLRTSSRKLSLRVIQVSLLQKYRNNFRRLLLNHEKESQFYLSSGSSSLLKNSLSNLIKKIKKINPKVKSLGQLRRSTISHWLKRENMRKVQYKAGHKYLSSTQKYRSEAELENLQDQIDHLHPLN